MVDTQELLMHAIVHSANVQDRDGGVLLVRTLFGLYSFLCKLFADAGYQGPKFEQAVARVVVTTDVKIVSRSDAAKDFVVLPRRWA